ncbi:PadR family transcriptional regulator [Embleya hyalina]|uniref:PadR family transcriptional regulator n=1 Tax=Embleya hyalina TaxID=516124 RepID=A0A401YQY3_9ACTN|nr:helix-turn-helix transcriptional regulator [Embleya hyalina]GCD96965.1 PadR family transcriptional regulator [Embleya hyalina]
MTGDTARESLSSRVLRVIDERGAVHGAGVLRDLTEHGDVVTAGMVYPLLSRLEAEGLLECDRRVVEGTTRRVYRLTAVARSAAEEDRRLPTESPGGASSARSPATT